MANLAEICHGFGEYMTIDEKKGDERFYQFTIFDKTATFQGPILPSHSTFWQTFREISPNPYVCCFVVVRHIRVVALLESMERFNLQVNQEGKTIIPS